MKKYLRSMLLLAAAIVSASMFASCGEDETDDLNPGQKEPENKVEMGYYKLDFPSLMITEWPDTKSIEEIEKKYDAYKKSITDALKYEEGKKYKWSEIEADKDRLQKIFDGFGDFEYEVRNCGNNFSYAGQHTSFSAFKEGAEYADIKFGEKKINCKLNVPENVTGQLMVTITTMDVIPSANEYNTNVKNLFIDAIKDVFVGEYEKIVTKDKFVHSDYYNLADLLNNDEEVITRVKEACNAVKVPAIPEDVLKEAQAYTPGFNFLFNITIEEFFLYGRGKNVFGYTASIL